MDAANAILLIAQPNLPSLKNASRFINLTESLNYEPRKIWLVINGVTDKQSISVKNITNTLRRPVIMTIPEDNAAVSAAANRGKPLVMGSTQKKPVSQSLEKLAARIVRQLSGNKGGNGAEVKETDTEKQTSTGLLGRLLKR
jgi:Flp pilus assembly CpaE family ATPase